VSRGLYPRTATRSKTVDAEAVREQALALAAATLQEARQARNRRAGDAEDLRCECPRPTCRETLPAAAEAHRGWSANFLVVPWHAAGETAVAVADRFFVVEPQRATAGNGSV
jgi:hypothetical protein